MSNLGDYFRCEYKCRLLHPRQVAHMVGYKNIKKGFRRLLVFERTGVIKPGLLVKLVDFFGWDWRVTGG